MVRKKLKRVRVPGESQCMLQKRLRNCQKNSNSRTSANVHISIMGTFSIIIIIIIIIFIEGAQLAKAVFSGLSCINLTN